MDVMFVLPHAVAKPFSSHVRLMGPAQSAEEFGRVVFRPVDVAVSNPYQSAREYARQSEVRSNFSNHNTPNPTAISKSFAASVEAGPAAPSPYACDLFSEIHRFARLASAIARSEIFDVVHAHDWMTFPAGAAVARMMRKPLVLHVHSTEVDRSGEGLDQRIYDIERQGVHEAGRIIAVSQFTKNILVRRYDADPSKIEVVYNGVEPASSLRPPRLLFKHRDEKIVLFLGRITMQKGPEYFLNAARRVLEIFDRVKFIMAGAGDMMNRSIEQAAAMGIGGKVHFTGFLRGADVDRVFNMADLYVMPSVSEPFGISPLEAINHDVPVIISKQSGVSEVLNHALKVDFWDTDEIANKIVAVLRHPPLAGALRAGSGSEIGRLNWIDAARACVNVYHEAGASAAGGTIQAWH